MQFYVSSLWVDCKGVFTSITPLREEDNGKTIICAYQFCPLGQRVVVFFCCCFVFTLGFCENNKRIHLKELNLCYLRNYKQITKYVFEGAKSRSDCGYKYTWVTAWNTWVNSALSFDASLHWYGQGSHVFLWLCGTSSFISLLLRMCFFPLLLCMCFYSVCRIGTMEACILSFLHVKISYNYFLHL